MKQYLIALSILSLTLTACSKKENNTAQVEDSSVSAVEQTTTESGSFDVGELPAILFIVRTDISDTLSEMSAEEIEQHDIIAESLGFYDKEGNYYTSSDPNLNAMDNQTLIAEYEAGHLTEQIQYYTSCDTDILAKEYAKLLKIYQKEKFEIVNPNEFPDVQAESSTWYGYYFDQVGNIQCCTIHQRERSTDLYTNNDTINEVYEWIIETFKNAEQSK
ncbi:MAG: hypothetical protein J1F04_04635 [Oscillospiraceae bacterium]|nr:hypothetical protein [Oscillospiraceae bacterium]